LFNIFNETILKKLLLSYLLLLNVNFLFAQQDTAVRMTTQLDNSYLCPDKQEAYLYVDLKSCAKGQRVPLNISVVFDRSGSMEGDRIYYGKKAIEYLIDQLQPDDIMSIVIYDHEASVLHGAEPVKDKAALKRKLEHIHPRGATNLSAGLELGIAEVRSKYDRTKINRVFLFSDGHPNEGVTDPYILERIVSGYAQRDDVSVSTFGVGHEFNEYLMHDLAEAGAGNYYYIQQPSDIINDFGSEITTLMSVAAQSTKFIIQFPSDNLTINKVYGYPYRVMDNKIYIDLKEVHPGETNGVLIKFLVDQPPTTPVNFITSLTYVSSIQQHKVFTIEKTNTLNPSTNTEDCKSNYNQDVLDKMVYYSSHYLMESAVKDVENDNIPSAKKKLAQGKQIIASNPSSQSSPLLNSQYQAMTDYETNLSTWHTKNEAQRKHIQKNAHYHNYKIRKQRPVKSTSTK
jgi:Ca-activated chloride channel family protein